MSKLKERINKIRKELEEIDLMLPGRISRQWYICGKEGCKCMDKKNPQKHGPYNQLSYTLGGKSSTMIVKEEDLEYAIIAVNNYKRFRELNLELVKSYIALIREEGFPKKKEEL